MTKDTKGWIVSLWIDKIQAQPNEREKLPYLSWSPYDRVTISEVDKFSGFFESENKVSWNGTVQHLHLIPMQKDFNWQLGDDCLLWTPALENRCYGMYCIVTARFKRSIEDIRNVKERIHQKITGILQGRKICWQGLFSG